MLQGILRQVADRLAKGVRIAANAHGALLADERDRPIAPDRQWRQRTRHIGDQRLQIGALIGRGRQGFKLRHGHQLPDQAIHALDILAQLGRDRAIGHAVQPDQQDGERRAQFMGRVGGEFALLAKTLVEPGKGAVDGGHQRFQFRRQARDRQP